MSEIKRAIELEIDKLEEKVDNKPWSWVGYSLLLGLAVGTILGVVWAS